MVNGSMFENIKGAVCRMGNAIAIYREQNNILFTCIINDFFQNA